MFGLVMMSSSVLYVWFGDDVIQCSIMFGLVMISSSVLYVWFGDDVIQRSD